MTIDYKYFKKKLEAEETLLENELEKVGRRNPDNLSDWEATPADKDISQADENIAVDTVETRYRDVKDALEKINRGAYGFCRVCNEEIDAGRLEANPSADTCRKHME